MNILKTFALKKYYGKDENLVRALDNVDFWVNHISCFFQIPPNDASCLLPLLLCPRPHQALKILCLHSCLMMF